MQNETEIFNSIEDRWHSGGGVCGDLLTVFGLSLLLPGNDLWNSLAFLLTYPWSVLIIFVAAWSIAHSGYPIELYFLPGAMINLVALYLLCRLSVRGGKSLAN